MNLTESFKPIRRAVIRYLISKEPLYRFTIRDVLRDLELGDDFVHRVKGELYYLYISLAVLDVDRSDVPNTWIWLGDRTESTIKRILNGH